LHSRILLMIIAGIIFLMPIVSPAQDGIAATKLVLEAAIGTLASAQVPAAVQEDPLFDAARQGDVKAVKRLLAQGRDPNIAAGDGELTSRTTLAGRHCSTRLAKGMVSFSTCCWSSSGSALPIILTLKL